MVTPVLAVLLAACLAQQPGEESTRSPVPRSAGASYVLFDRNRDWPPATQITGRIVDVAGRPLADAALELRERAPDRSRAVSSGSSGVDGRFELGVKPGGAHGESEHPLFLLVDAPALARSHVELRFSAYALPAELGDVVVYPPVALAGRVVDERGAPIAGADVFAVLGPRAVPYGDFAGMAPLATTDADGRYACRELPPGRVTLGVRAAGRADRVREDVRLDGAQPNAVDFVLLDEDVRVLRLTGPLGEPLVGASARLPGDYDRFGLGTGDAPWAFFRTSLAADKRGWIRVEGLAKGVSRRLVFEAHGYAPLSLRTDASEDVRLAPVTWIDVRTQRKGGGPAPELFQLSVRDDTTSPSWCGNCEDNHWQDLYADSPAVQRVAADHWRFAWNHPTCYVDGGRPQKISAVATDTSRALFEWEVPPAAGSPSEVSLEFEPTFELRGRVIDAAGRGVATTVGTGVSFDNGAQLCADTDADGAFVIPATPLTRRWIEVVDARWRSPSHYAEDEAAEERGESPTRPLVLVAERVPERSLNRISGRVLVGGAPPTRPLLIAVDHLEAQHVPRQPWGLQRIFATNAAGEFEFATEDEWTYHLVPKRAGLGDGGWRDFVDEFVEHGDEWPCRIDFPQGAGAPPVYHLPPEAEWVSVGARSAK